MSKTVRGTRPLLARILETPNLARAVPRLPAAVVQRVIESHGLEDCGALVALMTPEQLSAVFDTDLWRSPGPGQEEQLDVDRFGTWLEVLAESGAPAAAERLAAVDATLVVSALARFIAVFDPAAATLPGRDLTIRGPLADNPRCEMGGFIVVARRPDAWDTIVALLTALEAEHGDRFQVLMRGCRSLSNSTPEANGFHDLLTDAEQLRFDVAFEREGRREKQGYVTPAQASAFLQSSRRLDLERNDPPAVHVLYTAWARSAASEATLSDRTDPEPAVERGARAPEDTDASLDEVVHALLDAGVLHGPIRLLPGGTPAPEASVSRLHECMSVVQERDEAACARRQEELAFLANVLMAGCSVQSRSLTAREAWDCAAAVCNLGLENFPARWLDAAAHPRDNRNDGAPAVPDGFLVARDLVTVFQVGWRVLHRDVALFVARQLIAVIDDLRCADREIQMGLIGLRRAISRYADEDTPWRARDALEVIASLDLPAWAALLGLMDECPVMLANVADISARPLSVSTSDFEFISENRHLVSVRQFMRALPGLLRR